MSAGVTLGPASSEIDEAAIGTLVETFYERVRQDPVIGPTFDRAIGTTGAEWTPHLALMRDFWSSIMLTSGRYHGNPQVAHMTVPDLDARMFGRWLALFRGTCAELFTPDTADAFVGKAERIGVSLQRNILRDAR